ncbi:MAG: hypothetical protein HY592_05790 [Candidatus Omnitrophica bacterium]|nr:hypothetical protein [Candidatus Omnitrophota bacterium]
MTLFPIILLTLGSLALAGCGTLATLQSEPVQTLLEAKKDSEIQQTCLHDEEESFQKIAAAARDGRLQPQTSAKEILKKYGPPVIKIAQDDGEKWGYKSRKSTWFKGPKAYLYFDKDALLTRWESETDLTRD